MSSSPPSVYTGFWINWPYGTVHGSTITLSARDAAYFVAFVALFVRFAGGQLWSVVVYLASVTRSIAEPKDALYHQQQAILRNASSPELVTWAMLKLSWFWKGTATRVRTRTFHFIATGVLYIAAFAIAGIFSSRLSFTNSEVLLSPSHCGFWPYPYTYLFDPAKMNWQAYSRQRTEYATNIIQLIKKSHAYMSECHGINTTSESSSEYCLPYGRSRLAWNTNFHAPCPFGDDMCIADAIEFDTGFLHSDTHFGINSQQDHVEYRRVMTCAPIATDGHTSGYVNLTNLSPYGEEFFMASPGERFLDYAYGQSVMFADNTTFAYSDLSWGTSVGYASPYDIYSLDLEFAVADNDGTDTLIQSTFTPIPSLSRTDADTTIIFLSLNGTYLDEVRDPWFHATQPVKSSDVLADGKTTTSLRYIPNNLVNVAACTEQHQLRNPVTGATSPLDGSRIVTQAEVQRLGFTDNQIAVFNRSFIKTNLVILDSVIPFLGGSYLLAATDQYDTESIGLPDNQWQREFDHWFGIAMNTLQLWSQQYVTGPTLSRNDQYQLIPTDGIDEAMCSNQIVHNTAYRSFSVLGMGIVFSFGLFFIILNLSIRYIVERIQAHTIHGRYRNAEWQANDFLQLQRMAYQHNNMGTWVGHNDMVPRTNAGEMFTLPESTKWNRASFSKEQQEPRSDRRRLSRMLSRGWSSQGADAKMMRQPRVTEEPVSSDPSIDENMGVSYANHEKAVTPSEVTQPRATESRPTWKQSVNDKRIICHMEPERAATVSEGMHAYVTQDRASDRHVDENKTIASPVDPEKSFYFQVTQHVT